MSEKSRAAAEAMQLLRGRGLTKSQKSAVESVILGLLDGLDALKNELTAYRLKEAIQEVKP